MSEIRIIVRMDETGRLFMQCGDKPADVRSGDSSAVGTWVVARAREARDAANDERARLMALSPAELLEEKLRVDKEKRQNAGF